MDHMLYSVFCDQRTSHGSLTLQVYTFTLHMHSHLHAVYLDEDPGVSARPPHVSCEHLQPVPSDERDRQVGQQLN
jgi:hypothetical protein